MTSTKSYQKRQQENLVAAIQRYVDRGWPVFPCKPNKQPYTPNGFHDATTDIVQIANWWAAHRTALIGVPTGARSRFWVLDIDMKDGKDGKKALGDYLAQEKIDDIPDTRKQRTATGGYQLLYKWDDSRVVSNRTALLGRDSGLDVRGNGGYIIVPPSARKIDGRWVEYEWADIDFPIAEMPEWLYDLVARQTKYTSTTGDRNSIDLERLYVDGIHAGQRDDTLFRVASSLRAKDVDYHTALFVMRRLGERCVPYDDEVKQMIVAKLHNAYERYEAKTTKERKAHIDDVERREFDELLERQAKKAELRRLLKEYENDKDK